MHILILMLLFLSGQDPAPVAPFPFMDVPADLTLPDGNDAWVVEVMTRGGFDGKGLGDYRVTSAGKLNRDYRGRLDEIIVKNESLQIFAEFIPPATKVEWGKYGFGTCMDCVATFLRLKTRDKDGKVRTWIAYWDATTQRRVPSEVTRLYDAVIALAQSL